MEKKQQKGKDVDKKVLAFFLIAFPTIMIIALGMLLKGAWWAQVLLAFYQFVLLKRFLDDYYKVIG